MYQITIYTYTIKLQTKTATPKHQYFFQNLTFLESAHQKEAENARGGAKSRKVLKKSHPIVGYPQQGTVYHPYIKTQIDIFC